MSLTDDDVLHVLAVPKRVTEKIEWKSRPGSTPKFECSFSVRIPTREDPEQAVLGKVEATHNRYKTKCAFIYAGVCIRRWESVGPHKNPDVVRSSRVNTSMSGTRCTKIDVPTSRTTSTQRIATLS